MGFMDNFTTDGMVEMKHTEYYNLMREATKAELIEKAVRQMYRASIYRQ